MVNKISTGTPASRSFDHHKPKKKMKSINQILVIMVVGLGLITAANGQSLFKVDVVGKGKPMILIPGLYCGGEVWKETVDHYKDRYECHVVTIAGFNGVTPALRDNFLEGVKDDVVKYVKTKKLKKPVIVGHSLGAFLAFWISASAPGTFEKVIAVDGAPFLPMLQNPVATVESSKPMAENIRKGMQSSTPEQTLASQKQYLPLMITPQDKIDVVAEMASKSDSKTQGQVMYELFTIDLRETVASIDCPVLVLGAWVAYKNYGATHDSVQAAYTSQVSKVKDATVVLSDTAKHFIFYDDPTWFFEKTDGFLK
jgi:pimeloyl-ACP methyl ester carboxylesterase